MSQQQRIYLDDLAVGQQFTSHAHQMDVAQIVAFAQQFDPQPFHLDAEAAKDSVFQGLAASGWHTAAITMKLLVASLPLGSGIVGAGLEAQWPQPTRATDAAPVVSTVLEIVPSRSKPDRGMVTVECRTLNQHGELCQRMVSKLLVMRRPA